MRVLFTADLHIKLGQRNVPKDWQKNRFRMLFERYKEEQKVYDLFVIGGDIFDKTPNIDELALFFELVNNCTIPTIIFSGNHEATRKGKTFLVKLINIVKDINKNVTILDGVYKIENMDFIPYTNLKTFDPKDFSGNILFTHVRGEIKPHVQPEIDLDLLNRWTLVVAGDLHSHSNSQRNILYPGSPLTVGFHRNEVKTGTLGINSENMEYVFNTLNLPQLIRKTITDKKDIIKTDYHHTIYELQSNDTSSNNEELLDKQLKTTKAEATLDLKDMSVSMELYTYLKEVLKHKDVEGVMEVFNDYYKEA